MIPYLVILNYSDNRRVNYVNNQIATFSDKEFHIIPAILPAGIEDFIIENSIVINKGRYLAAKLACYLSHYLAFDTVVKNGYDHAIILEDDFVLFDNHDEQIAGILEELPADYDIVRLYYNNYKISPISGKKFIGKQDSVTGDIGNIVSLKGAEKIRAEFKTVEYEDILSEYTLSGFISNDIQIYKMGLNSKLISFNSVNVVVGTLGDLNKSTPGPLGSNINNKTEYYIQSE